MSQMRKTVSMATPARRRLRSRFSDAGSTGSTDAGVADVDTPVGEPQQTTSHSEKPTVTRPRTKSTAKGNTTRQAKRKSAVASELEPPPLPNTTSATLPNRMGDNCEGLDSGPTVEAFTHTVKRSATRLSRQGTRSSARLKGRNSTVIHEPAPIEPEIGQKKRKPGYLYEDNTAELPVKRAKHSDDQANVLVQTNGTTDVSDRPPVDLVLSENVVVDYLGQPADVVAEGSAAAGAPQDELAESKGFFANLGGLRAAFGLGGSGSE